MSRLAFTVLITDRHLSHIDIERSVFDPLAVNIVDAGFDRNSRAEQVLEVIRELNPDAIMSTYVPMTRQLLAAAPSCKIVVRYAVGYDTIDVEAATDLGVAAANVPDYGTAEVADHAMCLLLAATRKLRTYEQALREGRWGHETGAPIGRLEGRTLGIIGLGRIGSAVAARARGFGLRVLACDPYISRERFAAVGATPATLAELLAASDFVTLHVPLTDETRGMIGQAALAVIKPGAYLINTCRGEVVDQEALYRALSSGRLSGAGLDVFATEPVPLTEPLLALPNVTITPHIAWYSEESTVVKVRGTAEAVAAVYRGEWPVGLLNPTITGRSRAERWWNSR
jgi:D-3-phosphoglycerate dehydrogenase